MIELEGRQRKVCVAMDNLWIDFATPRVKQIRHQSNFFFSNKENFQNASMLMAVIQYILKIDYENRENCESSH